MKARYAQLLEKSVFMAVSAIEVYNKPDFKYREETFIILMVNAWEILFKAKILREKSNNLASIYIVDKSRKRKDGKPFKKIIYKKNRSKNYQTLDIFGSIKKLKDSAIELNEACFDNIEVLVEMRDNAIHFQSDQDIGFSKKVQDVGTTCLKNYMNLIEGWFGYSLEKFNFFLMPLSFHHDFYSIESLSLNERNVQIKNLLEYILSKEKKHSFDKSNKFNFISTTEVRFVKSKSNDAINIGIDPNSPNKVAIELKDEDIIKKYPLSSRKLADTLHKRYGQYFKENSNYFELKSKLKENEKYCKQRPVSPFKPNGQKQDCYSTEIIKEFDKFYTKAK